MGEGEEQVGTHAPVAEVWMPVMPGPNTGASVFPDSSVREKSKAEVTLSADALFVARVAIYV